LEKFDANKTATSNSSTVYLIARKDVVTDALSNGPIDLSTNLSGNPTKYIRLRILNQWAGSGNTTNGTLEIKRLSLLQLDSDENIPSIEKSGIIQAANFRENDLNKAMIFKKEGFETNCFYEI
jgi:hypothetical protein